MNPFFRSWVMGKDLYGYLSRATTPSSQGNMSRSSLTVKIRRNFRKLVGNLDNLH